MAGIVVEEAIEAMDMCEEAAEGVEEGIETEEIAGEIAEIRQTVSGFSKFIQTFETSLWPAFMTVVKNFANLAFAVVMLVQLIDMLKKKIKSGDPDAGKKNDVIAPLKAVIQTEMDLVQKLSDWLKEHKNDIITLDGMPVPMESVIAMKLEPVSKAADNIFAVVKSLTEKVDGKLNFKLPTTNDVINLIKGSEEFCKAFSILITFVSDNTSKVKELSSFPIKMSDVETLTPQLNHVIELVSEYTHF